MEPPVAPLTTGQNASFDFHPDPQRHVEGYHQIEDPQLNTGEFDLALLPECPLETPQDPFLLPEATLSAAAPPLAVARLPLQPGNVNATLHSNGDKSHSDNNTSAKKGAVVLSKTRNKANFPLVCYLCDNEPKYSDVSHLLTHLLSRGHARAKGNIEVRSHIPGDTEAAAKFAAFQKWQDDNGIGALLSERFLDKNNKKKEKDRVEAAKRKRFLEQQSGSFKKRKHSILPQVQPDFLDDFNMPPKSKKRGSGGPNHVESRDSNVGPGFLASQDLTYLDPGDKDDESHGISDLMDRSDVVSEYASDENETSYRAPELKGQFWPGMHLFDSATEENRKKRNQRKDDSVLQRMRIGSDAVNAREIVTDMNMNFERFRHIDEQPSEDELTPTKGSASTKNNGTRQTVIVSEDTLKQRSMALASMGERVSTPTKSTPRKVTPRKVTPRKTSSRKSTPRKYTPRKQAAIRTPSKKRAKIQGQSASAADNERQGVVGERRTKRGSAARAKSKIAEQAERDTYDDYEALGEDVEVGSPANNPIKKMIKQEAVMHIAREDSVQSSHIGSSRSFVDNTTANVKNEHGIFQDSAVNSSAGSAPFFAGTLPFDSRSSDAMTCHPYYDMGMVQQPLPQGLAFSPRFPHGMPTQWPAPGNVFNGYENHAGSGAVVVQSPGFYQGFQQQGLQQNPFYQQQHHQQSYAYPDQTFHDGMFQDPSGPLRSPQVLDWNSVNHSESPSVYGGQSWAAISPVEAGFPTNDNNGWVDTVQGAVPGNMGVHLEVSSTGMAGLTMTSCPDASNPNFAEEPVKLDPAQETPAPSANHFEDAMEVLGHT